MDLQSICTITSGSSRQFTTFEPDTGNKTVLIPPGKRITIAQCRDTGIVTRLWMTMPGWFWRHWDTDAPVDPTVLRLTIMRIYFDGCEYPSVEAPIGDFFGVGHCEYRHFTSRYLGMSSGGFYSYFPMPFEHGFRLELENLHATETAEVFFNLNWTQLDKLPEDIGRFHCAFCHGEHLGGDPLEIADINGKGHFAGCAVSIQGKDLNELSFLEAPEYIYLDHETEPTIVGTGLEDYFNGGWYFRNGEFCAQTHGVPLKDPLRSMVSMYRFHDEDRILFRSGFRMDFINPWKKERLKPYCYSSTAYYYLDKAQKACYSIGETSELTRLYRVRDVDFQAIP